MVSQSRRRRNAFYYLLLAGLLAVVWVSYKSFGTSSTESGKPLSEMLVAVDEKQVASATLTTDGDQVDWKDREGHQYRTLLPVSYASNLVTALHQDQVPFDVVESSKPDSLLSVVLPNLILVLVIGGLMWNMLRQSRQAARTIS